MKELLPSHLIEDTKSKVKAVTTFELELSITPDKVERVHPKCLGWFDYWGEFDCDYNTVLICDECKYGVGRKDPEAKCNQLK